MSMQHINSHLPELEYVLILPHTQVILRIKNNTVSAIHNSILKSIFQQYVQQLQAPD